MSSSWLLTLLWHLNGFCFLLLRFCYYAVPFGRMETIAPQFSALGFLQSARATQLLYDTATVWDGLILAAEDESSGESRWEFYVVRIFGFFLALWVFSVLIMSCAHSHRSGNRYECIQVHSLYQGSRWSLYFNYLWLLPLHFMRSTESATGDEQTLFSPAEKELLTSQRQIYDGSVLNFLSVRRTWWRVVTCYGEHVSTHESLQHATSTSVLQKCTVMINFSLQLVSSSCCGAPGPRSFVHWLLAQGL